MMLTTNWWSTCCNLQSILVADHYTHEEAPEYTPHAEELRKHRTQKTKAHSKEELLRRA